MSTEREAKLAASDDVVVPPLDGVVDGVVAGEPCVHRLHAIYYDTDDLVLARTGITLRHRSGESGEPWTLKLPGESSADELSRHELRFPGAADEVPADALDLVRAHTQGRRLGRVARLRTARITVELRGPDGTPLAEIADDRVWAYVDSRPVARFREIEVERLGDDAEDDDARDAAVDATIARLRAAGATAGGTASKLVHALGPAATMPPDVLVGAVDRNSDVRDFVRHVIAFSAARMLDHDPLLRLGPEVRDVHQFRVATRRLRSDLRTFDGLLDPEWVDALRTELKWIADVVGAVRDLDVLEGRLRDHASGLGDHDAENADALLAGLADQQVVAREELAGALRSERYDALMASLVAASKQPAFAGIADVDVHARPVVDAAVRRSWKRLRKEVKRAGKDPSDDELHHIRIVAKRARYSAEAASRIVGKRAARFGEAIADVQTVLGDHHDAAVAEEWLRDAAGKVDRNGAGVAAGLLIARQQREREDRAREWRTVWKRASRKKLRAWF